LDFVADAVDHVSPSASHRISIGRFFQLLLEIIRQTVRPVTQDSRKLFIKTLIFLQSRGYRQPFGRDEDAFRQISVIVERPLLSASGV